MFVVTLFALFSATAGEPEPKPAAEADSAAREHSPIVTEPNRIETFLHKLPSAWSAEYVLEMIALQAVLELEDTGGITRVDPQKLSVYGESNTWTRWWWNGIDISDPLFAGAQAFRLPFRFTDSMSLQSSEVIAKNSGPGVGFETRVPPPCVAADESAVPCPPRTIVGGTAVTPPLGGVSPGAIYIADKYSGRHPLERDPPPPVARRAFDTQALFTLVDTARASAGTWRYGVEATQGQRRFLAFSPQGFAGTFPERYTIVSSAAQYAPDDHAFALQLAGEFRQRDHLFAETHYAPAETAPMTSGALFLGLGIGRLEIGSTLKLYDIGSAGAGFTRDLHDLDGEGLLPYYPRGQWLGGNLDAQWEQPLPWTTLYAHGNEKWLAFLPALSTWTNPLVFDGAPTGRIDWQSRASAMAYGDIEVGLRDHLRWGPFEIGYDGYFFGTHTFNSSGRNALFLADAGLKVQVQWHAAKGFVPFISAARAPVPMTANLAQLLTPGLLSGRQYDGNGAQIDTLGDVSLGPHLLATKVHALALGFHWQLSRAWSLSGQGVAKAFDDTYWVQFQDGVAGNMSWAGDRYLYTPGGRRYQMGNYPWGGTPFFIGADGQLTGMDGDRYLVSLGLSTLFSLGTTAFGSGPTANDVGIVNTTMANPNGRLFPIGNMDGDRAFIFKLAVGYRFVSTLWGFLTARYRDGEPFAFIQWRAQDGQVAAAYQTNKGTMYNSVGPRTDGLINIDVQLAYTIETERFALRLALLLMNAWDAAGELTERMDVPLNPSRASLELQIPRTGMLTAELALP